MSRILGLIVLLLGCLEQSRKTEAVSDVFHSFSHQAAPVSAVHWPSIVGDDRSHRTGRKDSRLERSLFGSSGSSSSSSGICLEQSEISENTIIRTKDSRALGARFLNETSLGADARDRCMNLCCSFHGCNVAVYEEKVSRQSSGILFMFLYLLLLFDFNRMEEIVTYSTVGRRKISDASSLHTVTTLAV